MLGAHVDDPVEMPSGTSIDFRPSGFAVMRTDWSRESPYLVINYGEYGGGHSHPDVLSFELFAYGNALAVDAGIGVSYDDPLHRPWYKTSMAHNMLVIDDANLDRRIAVGERPVWSHQEGMDYFAAEHQGYRALGVRHRRHFLFMKPAGPVPEANPYFLIFDAFSSDAQPRKASFLLHSPTPLQRGGTAVYSTEAPRPVRGHARCPCNSTWHRNGASRRHSESAPRPAADQVDRTRRDDLRRRPGGRLCGGPLSLPADAAAQSGGPPRGKTEGRAVRRTCSWSTEASWITSSFPTDPTARSARTTLARMPICAIVQDRFQRRLPLALRSFQARG